MVCYTVIDKAKEAGLPHPDGDGGRQGWSGETSFLERISAIWITSLYRYSHFLKWEFQFRKSSLRLFFFKIKGRDNPPLRKCSRKDYCYKDGKGEVVWETRTYLNTKFYTTIIRNIHVSEQDEDILLTLLSRFQDRPSTYELKTIWFM